MNRASDVAPAADGAAPAAFATRGVAWSLDAALVAPLALLLAWRWLAPAAADWVAGVEALLHHGGRALGEALLAGTPLPRLTVALLRDPVLVDAVAATQAASWALAWPAAAAFALVGAAYHAVAECSAWEATAGKRLLGLRVRDRHGRRLRPGRALLRHGAGALSWATLNLGHLLAASAPRHLALHDRCSGTRVVACARADARLPRWASAWLAGLAVAALAATAWLATAAAAIMRAALELALY